MKKNNFKRIHSFNENDKDWDSSYFYRITIENGIKYIEFISETSRLCMPGKRYLSWGIRRFYDKKIELKKLVKWDTYYQIEKLLDDEENDNDYVIVEPDEAFSFANDSVNEDGNGSVKLDIVNLYNDVECGNYYGK